MKTLKVKFGDMITERKELDKFDDKIRGITSQLAMAGYILVSCPGGRLIVPAYEIDHMKRIYNWIAD